MAAHDDVPGTVVDHALARHTLTTLRDRETDGVSFRKGLVKLGRICGYELADGFDTEPVTVQTPVSEATGERVRGLDDVVVVNVLRAATPFVEGLLKAFPAARQGIVSAGRDEESGRLPDGSFPIGIDYVKLPRIRAADTVIVADPMLATGSTMCAVLDRLAEATGAPPDQLFVLSAVSAPEGLRRVADHVSGAEFVTGSDRELTAELVTVAVDEGLDDRGFIVPGLGDAGDRAFGTD